MDEYWHALSEQHQQKIKKLAETHGVTIECVFRNILRHLKWELGQMSGFNGFQHFITVRQIEGMIDLIAR
ncbi:MAG: hypothetical protein ABIL58_15235 [Pseudomonadota bacterium]